MVFKSTINEICEHINQARIHLSIRVLCSSPARLALCFKVTNLMNPEPIWVYQNQTHELHLYILVSFTVPHQDKPIVVKEKVA